MFTAVCYSTIVCYAEFSPDLLDWQFLSEVFLPEKAYKQVKNYQLDIPSLFWYNAFNVISDGINTVTLGLFLPELFCSTQKPPL